MYCHALCDPCLEYESKQGVRVFFFCFFSLTQWHKSPLFRLSWVTHPILGHPPIEVTHPRNLSSEIWSLTEISDKYIKISFLLIMFLVSDCQPVAEQSSEQRVELESAHRCSLVKGKRETLCPFRAVSQRRTDPNSQQHGAFQQPAQSTLAVSKRGREREMGRKKEGVNVFGRDNKTDLNKCCTTTRKHFSSPMKWITESGREGEQFRAKVKFVFSHGAGVKHRLFSPLIRYSQWLIV